MNNIWRMNKIWLLFLVACDLTAPHGIEIADVYKIQGQDESLLLAWGRFEEHFKTVVPNPVIDDTVQVFWTDTPCPYRPEQWAVVMDGRCYAGRMWGCDELYVAMNSLDPNKTCGTALLHEYGHCLSMQAGWGEDASHQNEELWDNIRTTKKEVCLRGW